MLFHGLLCHSGQQSLKSQWPLSIFIKNLLWTWNSNLGPFLHFIIAFCVFEVFFNGAVLLFRWCWMSLLLHRSQIVLNFVRCQVPFLFVRIRLFKTTLQKSILRTFSIICFWMMYYASVLSSSSLCTLLFQLYLIIPLFVQKVSTAYFPS